MSVKLVYTAPAACRDSLDKSITDPQVLAALAELSCLEGSVLEHLSTDIPDQDAFAGGYLRLGTDDAGKRLQVVVEIESPRELIKAELKALQADLDGQVSDGIGEGAFDYLEEAAGLTIETFGGRAAKSSLAQSTGTAWRPKSKAAEAKLNRQRCQSAARLIENQEQKPARSAVKGKAKAPTKTGAAARDIKPLLKLIQKSEAYPRPKDVVKQVAAEIANLGDDLSFIKSGKLPFISYRKGDVLNLLLEAGLNPNLHDKEGHSLLWCSTFNVKCLAALLEHGADVNMLNNDVFKETALMMAASTGEADSVRFLLEHGANPRLKTAFGDTALDQAKKDRNRSPDNRSIVALLEKAK